jgi:protein-tyrosine kinase
MERIQRALEISRLQRPQVAEVPEAVAVAPVPLAVSPGVRGRPEEPAAQTPLPRHAIDPTALRRRRVLFAHEPGVAAHAYRMLRAQLLQRARASRLRVFGIVSAVSGEGKTLTAVNLALSLASEPNQSVVLVDFDLRRPGIAGTLGITPAVGLETWLTAERPVSAVLCELEGVERLQIAPALAPVSPGSEMLATGRARHLLEDLKATDPERLVILDLPPALLSDDVLTIAPLVDGFILVVTERRTRRDDVERVLELIGRDRIVGTVLNHSLASEQRAY